MFPLTVRGEVSRCGEPHTIGRHQAWKPHAMYDPFSPLVTSCAPVRSFVSTEKPSGLPRPQRIPQRKVYCWGTTGMNTSPQDKGLQGTGLSPLLQLSGTTGHLKTTSHRVEGIWKRRPCPSPSHTPTPRASTSMTRWWQSKEVSQQTVGPS